MILPCREGARIDQRRIAESTFQIIRRWLCGQHGRVEVIEEEGIAKLQRNVHGGGVRCDGKKGVLVIGGRYSRKFGSTNSNQMGLYDCLLTRRVMKNRGSEEMRRIRWVPKYKQYRSSYGDNLKKIPVKMIETMPIRLSGSPLANQSGQCRQFSTFVRRSTDTTHDGIVVRQTTRRFPFFPRRVCMANQHPQCQHEKWLPVTCSPPYRSVHEWECRENEMDFRFLFSKYEEL